MLDNYINSDGLSVYTKQLLLNNNTQDLITHMSSLCETIDRLNDKMSDMQKDIDNLNSKLNIDENDDIIIEDNINIDYGKYFDITEDGVIYAKYQIPFEDRNYITITPDTIQRTLKIDGCTYICGRTYELENDGITELVIPETINGITVKELGTTCLSGCKLIKLTLPSTLKVIGPYALYTSVYLEELNIPYGVEELATYSLGTLIKLKHLRIPDSVTYFSGIYAFHSLSGMESDIIFPKYATSFNGEFQHTDCNCRTLHIPYGYSKITHISFNLNLVDIYCPNTITSITHVRGSLPNLYRAYIDNASGTVSIGSDLSFQSYVYLRS